MASCRKALYNKRNRHQNKKTRYGRDYVCEDDIPARAGLSRYVGNSIAQ